MIELEQSQAARSLPRESERQQRPGRQLLASAKSLTRGLANCVATAVLPGGSLTGQGVVEISSAGTPHPTDLAITGGTGRYAGARGTLHVKNTTGYEIFKFMLQPGTS